MEGIILKELIRLRTRNMKSYRSVMKEQAKRFRNIVLYAYNNSKFYRELYDKYEIDIEHYAIEDLPIITKEDIINNYDDILTVSDINYQVVNDYVCRRESNNLLGKYSIFSSGGSSGIRCHIPYDLEGMCTINGLTLLRSGLFQGKIKQRIAFMGGVNHSNNTGNLSKNSVLKNQFQILVIPLFYSEEQVINELNVFQPTTIASYSYMLRSLAIAQLEGRLQIHPTRLRCGGTPFLDEDKKIVYEAFGMLPIENYGSCEALMMGSACREHCGMHINEDCYKIEFVDTDLNPIKEGDISDGILLTNLYNRVFPLIRYKMDDRLTYTTKKCKCGCNTPRILTVQGRKTDSFIFYNKTNDEIINIHPIEISNRMLDIKQVREFRLIQKRVGILSVNLSLSTESDTTDLVELIRARIQDYFESKNLKASFEIVQYKELIRDSTSGKMVPFITINKYDLMGPYLEINGSVLFSNLY